MNMTIDPPKENQCRGATGLFSNAEDLLTFTTIDSKAKKIYASDQAQGFGLGWQHSKGIWYAYNQMRGYSGFIGHHPDKAFAFVLLISGETPGLTSFSLDYMEKFDDWVAKMEQDSTR